LEGGSDDVRFDVPRLARQVSQIANALTAPAFVRGDVAGGMPMIPELAASCWYPTVSIPSSLLDSVEAPGVAYCGTRVLAVNGGIRVNVVKLHCALSDITGGFIMDDKRRHLEQPSLSALCDAHGSFHAYIRNWRPVRRPNKHQRMKPRMFA
jgi:hypothetical protein